MLQVKLKSFLHFERSPTLQWWLVRVREEFFLEVRKAFRDGLFRGPPRFIGKFSELFAVIDPSSAPFLVKRIRAQKEADYVRRSFHCQGKREFLGSTRLSRIGIECPEPIGFGVNLVPWSRMDSIFICSFLTDAVLATEMVKNGAGPRVEVNTAVARDLRTMLANHLYFRDLHSNNLLVRRAVPRGLSLYWIDNDVRPFAPRHGPRRRELLLERWTEVTSLTDQERASFDAALRNGAED